MALIDFMAVTFRCPEEFRDILIAELAELGYDTMMEIEDGLEAYIPESDFNQEHLDELLRRYASTAVTYSTSRVVTRNWNEEWEKNYDPIEVDGICRVRAVFHEANPEFKYEIIINPRMSFGTGHHSTTWLMMKHQLETDHVGKRVLDAGCGTAILAVLAEKLGAREVLAYDNNSWTIENAPENLSLNNCQSITIQEGTISTIDIQGAYDIILANINKNVLLEEMDYYNSYLVPGGVLMLSGFYDYDEQDIINRVIPLGFELVKTGHRNHWSALLFHKK
ncbi:50S ribosomal protein L11 methyltransferase [Fulvivirga sedimenti]|uniref:Ribosomal protein L11 methyltransferase n=1 Tax=Fulvivirga sedimenti TaxID=2879465 RepID=A0A9X1HXK0_9BACT|nr:50S ribosomal protein L11 methyltransferase [Fulvivirga sedimenti]MCA6078597.1 50S ribosomal protein L11 methyltransferase [Fulvivirga sedimenti]